MCDVLDVQPWQAAPLKASLAIRNVGICFLSLAESLEQIGPRVSGSFSALVASSATDEG